MTSLNLVPRAGQMILNFGISSSGDDARTVDIPFGTLATEGGSIAIPKALKISIQSSSGIPISGSDVVCQAFKDAQGTQVLGKSFTQSSASSLGPEPVTIGAIFCSDAKSVEARIGGNDPSAQTTSAGSDVATTTEAQSFQTQSLQDQSIQTQSSQAQTQTQIIIAPTTSASDTSEPATRTKAAASSSASKPQQTTPSPSPAIDPLGSGGKPTTIQQSSAILMDTGSAPSMQSTAASTGMASVAASRSTSLSSVTSVANIQSSGAVSSSSAAAAQTTSAAYSVHTHELWTVRRIVNVSILAACYIGWFTL